MARSTTDKKYTRIEPWYTREDIMQATAQAPVRRTQQYQNTNLMKSQSLRNLPKGHVASYTADLEEFVVAGKGRTRQAKKASGALEA